MKIQTPWQLAAATTLCIGAAGTQAQIAYVSSEKDHAMRRRSR